jgi:hypothetical protein
MKAGCGGEVRGIYMVELLRRSRGSKEWTLHMTRPLVAGACEADLVALIPRHAPGPVARRRVRYGEEPAPRTLTAACPVQARLKLSLRWTTPTANPNANARTGHKAC